MSQSAAKLTECAAVLLVKDVVAAANHYREKMGFHYDRFIGEPPSFVILHRDGLQLMLKQADDPKHVVPHWTVSDKLCDVYFWVSDADALHREFVERDATIDYGPCTQPYGCREFGAQDLDGHDISFGQFIGGKLAMKKYKVEIHAEEAKIDFYSQIEYLAAQNCSIETLNKFLDEMEAASNAVSQNPITWPLVRPSKSVRKFGPTKKFRYLVFYVVLENDALRIIDYAGPGPCLVGRLGFNL